MKKTVLCLAVLLLCLLPLSGLAAHFPDMSTKAITLASGSSLPQKDYDELCAFAQNLEERAGIRFRMVSVYFFDGSEDYAGQLFSRWGLGENDLLLVCAEAENRCAVSMGSAVSEKLGAGPENLLCNPTVNAALENGELGEALTSYCFAMSGLTPLQGMGLETLLPQEEPQQDIPAVTPQPVTIPAEEITGDETDEDSTSPFVWIGLALVAIIIISQSDSVRKARRERAYPWRSYGCGCSPLGWFLGLFGFSRLIDRILKHR